MFISSTKMCRICACIYLGFCVKNTILYEMEDPLMKSGVPMALPALTGFVKHKYLRSCSSLVLRVWHVAQ